MKHPLRFVHLAVALALALTMTPGDQGLVPLASPVGRLQVEVGGCASVLSPLQGDVTTREPVCAVARDRSLRLWSDISADAHLTVTLDSQPYAVTWRPLQGGLVADVSVPDGARRLTVASLPQGEAFVLALTDREVVPALEEAEALRQAGKLDEATVRAKALLGDQRASVRARASGMLARIARRKDPAAAVVLFRDAMDRDREAGLVSDFVKDGLVLAMTLLDDDLSAASAVLDSLQPTGVSYPEGRAMSLYYRSLLLLALGDLRAALASLTASARDSERLGLDLHRVDVLQMQAEGFRLLGRPIDAWRSLTEAQALLFSRPDARPCAKAQLFNNVGWFLVGAASPAEGTTQDWPDPSEPLSNALALFRGACPDPAEAALVLMNLAISALDRGSVSEAQRFLDESRTESPLPGRFRESIRTHLEARLALARGKPNVALQRYKTLAAESILPDAMLIAVAGAARAEDALGHAEAARKAYAEADVLLDRWSLAAPFGEGRQTFETHHLATTRARIDFLVRQSERATEPQPWLEEAATAARHDRARALASLPLADRIAALSADARDKWQRSVNDYRRRRAKLEKRLTQSRLLPANALAAARDAMAAEQALLTADFERALAQVAGATLSSAASLPPPAAGELLLVYHPLEEGWIGFALDGSTTLASRMPLPDPEASAERAAELLLSPFDSLLSVAQRIRFAPSPPLNQGRLRALPWRGRSLLARFPMVEGLDVATPVRSIEAPLAAPWAVIVADPEGNLPAARREASAVAEALSRHGYQVLRIEGQEATFEAVRAALEQRDAKHFHYAGHGTFLGRDGWESGLLLAAGAVLRVPDVLALSHVPSTVVLSGCETGRSDEHAPLEGLGVAQAFVLAGATSVAAATRDVEDRLAEHIMTALYDAPSDTFIDDLASGLRRAELAISGGAPTRWSSFEVFAP